MHIGTAVVLYSGVHTSTALTLRVLHIHDSRRTDCTMVFPCLVHPAPTSDMEFTPSVSIIAAVRGSGSRPPVDERSTSGNHRQEQTDDKASRNSLYQLFTSTGEYDGGRR